MSKAVYFFGGTFDPVHQGHLGVIKELLAKGLQVVVAITSSNPFKKESYASFEQRLDMLRLVLDFEGIPYSETLSSEGVCLSNIRYEYVSDFIKEWSKLHGRDSATLNWVVGPDIADEVSSWKDWSSLNL